MSQVFPAVDNCCYECAEPIVTSTPGPQGDAGEDGTDGTNGVNAYTNVANYFPAAQPQMPAEGASTSVNVTSSTNAFEVGQPVFVQNWGTLFVTFVTPTSLTLQNPENTASGTYASNAAPGTPLAATSKIVPGGIQGPAGILPGDALLASNDLSDVNSAATSRSNLGLGTAAVLDEGTADGDLPRVDDAAGLVSGEMMRATASGIESVTPATARTSMGLGTMAVQSAAAVSITGGALNGTLGATTPSTVAATTLAASGATTLSGDLTAAAKVFTPSTAIQSLLAATTVNPNAAKIRVVGNGGAVTLTAVPTISNPAADGQIIRIMGTDDTNTVTFQDETALAGSNLRLAGGANRTLGNRDVLTLMWDATLAEWVECSFSNN